MNKFLFICIFVVVSLLSPMYLTAKPIIPLSRDLYIYQTKAVLDRAGKRFPSLRGKMAAGSCANGYTLHTFCSYEVLVPVNTRSYARGKKLTIRIKSAIQGKYETLGTKDFLCEREPQLEVITIFPSSAGKYGRGDMVIELYDENKLIDYHSCVIKIVK